MAKSLYIIIILVSSTITCFCQSGGSANISATISHPVGTQKINDMNFGKFVISNSAGSIELNTSNNSKSTGGVVLTDRATATLASLYITGDFVYAITMPSDGITLKRNGGEETMRVGSFYFTTLGTQQNQLLAIGATLKVGASQLPGNYNSVEALAVTVNYN